MKISELINIKKIKLVIKKDHTQKWGITYNIKVNNKIM